MSIFDEKTCAELAKTLTAMCVRNAEIENIHAGKPIATKTGDYSDVQVIDADGNEFAWPEFSHISDDEMKVLMKGVVNRLYTFMMQGDVHASTRIWIITSASPGRGMSRRLTRSSIVRSHHLLVVAVNNSLNHRIFCGDYPFPMKAKQDSSPRYSTVVICIKGFILPSI